MTKTIEKAAREASLNRGRGVIIQADLNGNIVKRWNCVKDIQSAMGCSTGCLSECLNHKVKYHKGYIWIYEKDICLIPQIVEQINISRDNVIANGEEWRDIAGYERHYQVSSYGRVKSLKREGHPMEHILKPKKRADGYYSISLYHGRNYKRFQIHRLVAQAFIPNPNNYPIINHKDENRTNNRVENLEWCSYRYNALYSKCPSNELNRPDMSLPVAQYTTDGILVKEYPSIAEAARAINSTPTSVSNACYGKTKTCYGFVWRLITPKITHNLSSDEISDIKRLYAAVVSNKSQMIAPIAGKLANKLERIFGSDFFK